MNFQDLKNVEKADHYIDVAFRKAKESGEKLKEQKLNMSKLDIVRKVELRRIEAVKDSIQNSMDKILSSFPDTHELAPFYYDLLDCTVTIRSFKKSLSTMRWIGEKSQEFFKTYSGKIRGAREVGLMNRFRKEFYGRMASTLKRVNADFEFLESTRKIMKEYPSIKKGFTVTIVGFPNIGKTTLLYKLTGSKPEIANYSFTTKTLNMGYTGGGQDRIQYIDTPGSLNRFSKMNNIEKQSYLALKHCANLIVYVFDLTEPYPLEQQIELCNTLRNLDKKMIIYLSKTDILDKQVIKDFTKNYHAIISLEELKIEIAKEKKEYDWIEKGKVKDIPVEEEEEAPLGFYDDEDEEK